MLVWCGFRRGEAEIALMSRCLLEWGEPGMSLMSQAPLQSAEPAMSPGSQIPLQMVGHPTVAGADVTSRVVINKPAATTIAWRLIARSFSGVPAFTHFLI